MEGFVPNYLLKNLFRTDLCLIFWTGEFPCLLSPRPFLPPLPPAGLVRSWTALAVCTSLKPPTRRFEYYVLTILILLSILLTIDLQIEQALLI